KQGVAPQQFVDEITAKFVALWEKLDVHYDDWAATTAPRHKDCVRAILQRLWDQRGGGARDKRGTDLGEQDPATGASRWLYKKTEGGWYSVRQEQFLTDKERGPDGEFGPAWQPVEFREEENFYFRLLDHKQWLLDLIDARSRAGRPLVVPDYRVAELRNAVEKLESDLCISRPASRLQWGIPFPESFGAGFVTYVWFDALVNYLSFAPGYDPAPVAAVCDRRTSAGEGGGSAPPPPTEIGDGHRPPLQEFRKWWPALHVIGKDILIPAHGVYWPIMLKALGFGDDEMPTLLVHGWWNIAGAKMSKSLGNIIDPDALADKYGPEALRYYLMSDIATGRDADFSEERLIQRYNTDLANSLGNLLNRTLSMAGKYRDGRLTLPRPSQSSLSPNDYEVLGQQIRAAGQIPRTVTFHDFAALADSSLTLVTRAFDECRVDLAIGFTNYLIDVTNRAVQMMEPWVRFKDPILRASIDLVLYELAESLRIIAILIYPVLPRAAHGIFDQLNWKMNESGRSQRFHLDDAKWGGLPDGHVLGKPTPLFPRIEAQPV
ncbi:MAG TPA: class I tRNA ligase family protein, partial [Chthoniobacteraceae bacterium]|nr:class I tRNA ligase family protein [Chthoniobacteraceae bacterium]